ncbi:nose resistant to fluoxetine protein 6, partial [Biomphalaria glabrata]
NEPDLSQLNTVETVFYALCILAVDTFFTISGLLVAYSTLKKMSTKSWKYSWGSFYFHRFW